MNDRTVFIFGSNYPGPADGTGDGYYPKDGTVTVSRALRPGTVPLTRNRSRQDLNMKKRLFTCILLLLLFIFRCIQAEDPSGTVLEAVRLEGNSFSCSFDGIRHNFILDLPEKTEGAPLVIMLPGYGNTAESFRDSVHFEREANPLGYAAAYVTGSRNLNDPVSAVGWNSGIGNEGNDDVGFLTALARYLQEEYSFDEKRTFAVGFSNGAFMAHRLAMEADSTFSACVSVAGLMPEKIWNGRKDRNNISFFQITGEKDDAVPKNSDGSAVYAKDPAIEDVMAYWAGSNGLDLCESETAGKGSVLTKCRSGETPNQVWHLFVKNGRHSWPGADLNGIDTNSLILEFFSAAVP